MSEPAWLWAVVLIGIVALITADTYFFDRGSREISTREAIVASLVWIGLAMLFGIGVWLIAGWPNAEEYFSAYLLEKGMAVDNLFVITMILAYFAVPRRYQYRVLFDPWGLSVTLVFRAGLIILGIAALNHFRSALYVLGAFVVIAGVRLASNPRAVIHPERNPFLRLLGRLVPIGHEYHGESYLVRMNGRLSATPLLAALVVIETSELLFALDSIPTVLGVTDKAFLVFTSNALALLGLRSLYFLLSRVIVRLTYVRIGVAIVMIFIGVKLILTDVVHVAVWESLSVVAIIILASAVASVLLPMLTGPRSGDRLARGTSAHVENLPGD